MDKVTLYKIDSTGKTREWNIWVDKNPNGTATIQISAGVHGGKMVPSSTPINEGKNIGRANETTAYTQAVSEAQSEIDKKTTKGYVADINAMNAHGVLGSGIKEAMLAKRYHPQMKQKDSKNLEVLKLEGAEIGVQIKIDGNRCLTRVDVNGAEQFTRKGKPFIKMPHITDAVHASFMKVYDYINRKYGVTEYMIDGELYSDQASFNTINGILKKQKRTAEEQKIVESVKYFIYDVVLPVGYETRHKVTQYFDGGVLVRVPYTKIVATTEEIDKYFVEFLKQGHEGLMIRQLNIPYEHKRTFQLLKYKAFEDAEFEIVGFEESRKKGTLGAIIFQQKNPFQTFNAATTGLTAAEQKDMWDNQDKWLGTFMTVTYFGFSEPEEGGKPRFPKAKGERVEETVED